MYSAFIVFLILQITEEGAKILENLSITKIDDLVDIVTKDGYADKTIKVSNGTKFKFPYGRDFVSEISYYPFIPKYRLV